MARRTYDEQYIRERNPSLGPYARPGRDPLVIDRFVGFIRCPMGLIEAWKIENGHAVEKLRDTAWDDGGTGQMSADMKNTAHHWANQSGNEVDYTRIMNHV